jgi:hypothetical protein
VRERGAVEVAVAGLEAELATQANVCRVLLGAQRAAAGIEPGSSLPGVPSQSKVVLPG